MKRVMVLILALALMGCATTKQHHATVEDREFARRIVPIHQAVAKCMNLDTTPVPMVSPDKSPNAWVDGDKVYFTIGLRNFDDETLTFITAHEYAHLKLGHQGQGKALSYGITGVMLVANVFIPGVGLLNHAVNPAISNNFSKSQESDADKLASNICSSCLNIPIENQIATMYYLKARLSDSGGFWDRHPSWDDRIYNIAH
jgi:Zn-dependent protease with chaperone function